MLRITLAGTAYTPTLSTWRDMVVPLFSAKDLPGYTRSVYKPDHALITPESRVYAPLFGWCGDGSMLPPRR